MWRTGVPTIQTWSSKQATNSVPSCHPNCRDLNKPKALHQCFDALQVRDHLVSDIWKKIQRTKLWGKPSHLPSGSSSYMLFHVKYIYIHIICLQLYTSRMLQLFNVSKSKNHPLQNAAPQAAGSVKNTEVLHTMRSKWQPELGRDYKFQAWDFHWKTPSVVKTANAYVFFLDFDFPCLKKFCFLPCRIVRTNLRFRNKIFWHILY